MSAENLEKGRGSAASKGLQNGQEDSREHHLDKTIEDSFPASDPPSTDPNPGGDE